MVVVVVEVELLQPVVVGKRWRIKTKNHRAEDNILLLAILMTRMTKLFTFFCGIPEVGR